jgi:hypothetical protein
MRISSELQSKLHLWFFTSCCLCHQLSLSLSFVLHNLIDGGSGVRTGGWGGQGFEPHQENDHVNWHEHTGHIGPLCITTNWWQWSSSPLTCWNPTSVHEGYVWRSKRGDWNLSHLNIETVSTTLLPVGLNKRGPECEKQ